MKAFKSFKAIIFTKTLKQMRLHKLTLRNKKGLTNSKFQFLTVNFTFLYLLVEDGIFPLFSTHLSSAQFPVHPKF